MNASKDDPKTNKQPRKELQGLLKTFAEWTIKNVEHGIYIPLPSPETEIAIKSLFLEIVDQPINIYLTKDESGVVDVRDDVIKHFDYLRAELHERIKEL